VSDKPIFFVGSSRDDLRGFPDEARQAAGHQLWRLEQGLEPDDWGPMKAVGVGVNEIRIQIGDDFRVFYVAKFSDGIYVLHAFEKKSQQTKDHDIRLGQRRLAEVQQAQLARRKEQKTTKQKIGRFLMAIISSTGDVFRDLGFSESESKSLRLRSKLMLQLREVIDKAGLTQVAAARMFNVSQPRVSDLVRGKIHLFSLDTLVDMLGHAGIDVEVSTVSVEAQSNSPNPTGWDLSSFKWASIEIEAPQNGAPVAAANTQLAVAA
jgi:phage-related protein/predicted XRE-type DNA-binding protein